MKNNNGFTLLSIVVVGVLSLLLAFPLFNAQVDNITRLTTPGQCPAGYSGMYPSCVATVLGCTNPGAANYDPKASVDDGSCASAIPAVEGCTNPGATNYNPKANVDDGTCNSVIPAVDGCTNPGAANYNPKANVNDGSCKP